jgi:molybdate transport system substrate-binding protein
MKRLLPIAAALLAGLGCRSAPAPPPPPAEIRVLSSTGVRWALQDLKPEIERAIGHPISIEFGTAASLKARIDKGEPFDVAILTPDLTDDLVSKGKLVNDGRVNVGRVGMGVGVRDGAPKADISTGEALKTTLLNAKSVAFTAQGLTRPIIDQAFDRLGITRAMQPKLVPKSVGDAPGAVAVGEAELVLALASEVASAPGVQLLGQFPPEVQAYTWFVATRSPRPKDLYAADTLVRQLAEPSHRAALNAHLIQSPPFDDPRLAAADSSFSQAIARRDKAAMLRALDDDATWTDADGRMFTKADIARALPTPAIPNERAAEVRRMGYGMVGVVQVDRENLHELRVWVERPAGWRLLIQHEVKSADAPPTVTPNVGKSCDNPCRGVPYEPKSDNEQGVIAAFQTLETAIHSGDPDNWGNHVADEFVFVSSNNDRKVDKPTRMAAIDRGVYTNVPPTELVSTQMFEVGFVVVMRSLHQPESGAPPLRITGVWVKRDGIWAAALTYQTSIRPVLSAAR